MSISQESVNRDLMTYKARRIPPAPAAGCASKRWAWVHEATLTSSEILLT